MSCRKEIGAFASRTDERPRSEDALGKIMRRILRKIAANQVSEDDGDTSTLTDALSATSSSRARTSKSMSATWCRGLLRAV